MGTSIEAPFQLTVPCYPSGILHGDTAEPKQTIFEESSTQQYTLGTQLWYPNGDKFRYTKNGGTALAKGYMTCSATNTANCVAEAQGTSGTSVAIGDQEIVVDVTNASGITDDLYAQGWLSVDTSTGAGDLYKILACSLLTTTTARLLLETPIRTAWAAGTTISLLRNRWRDVVVFPTTATQPATGIPLIAVTANYYCWLKTRGEAPCIVDTGDTIVLGELVGKPGTHAVAGACGVPTAGTSDVWGVVRYVVAAASFAVIDLRLD